MKILNIIAVIGSLSLSTIDEIIKVIRKDKNFAKINKMQTGENRF
jgi:hypothetical protein